MFAGLNYIAILVCAVFYFLFGGLWYALILNRPWQAGLNFPPEVKTRAEKDFPKSLAVHFVSGLLTSLVIAYIIRFVDPSGFAKGMVLGFWLWLGFAFTLGFNSFMFEKRPAQVFQINNGFFLITFSVIAGVLTVWR